MDFVALVVADIGAVVLIKNHVARIESARDGNPANNLMGGGINFHDLFFGLINGISVFYTEHYFPFASHKIEMPGGQ